MRFLSLTLVLLFSQTSLASSFTLKDWEAWKDKTYGKYLTEPTSYLNAISLSFAKPRERLYLSAGKSRESSLWQKKRSGQSLGFVSNHKYWGLLTRPGHRDKKISPENKRYHWKLANGALAEVVYGTSSGKVWTYIYDPDQIKRFSGFRFYPFDSQAVVSGTYRKIKPVPVSYKTVQGDRRKVYKVGAVDFMLRGKKHSLAAYNWQETDEKLSYIALIFTDLKAGKETYGGGRELAIELSKDLNHGDTLTLDFNRTGNFYCAHSPFWHCPTGLQEPLKVAVNAGEMNPLKKIARKR